MTKDAPEMPDAIWICPSGNKTYSVEADKNTTPELKYIRADLVPEREAVDLKTLKLRAGINVRVPEPASTRDIGIVHATVAYLAASGHLRTKDEDKL